jgi:LPXTG-motif cell wall-anchored protein
MKKTIITLTLILGITMTTFADGGLFNRGYNAKNGYSGYNYFGAKVEVDNAVSPAMPLLPQHGQETNQSAPLGSGIAVLMGLGAAYMVAKKRREE